MQKILIFLMIKENNQKTLTILMYLILLEIVNK